MMNDLQLSRAIFFAAIVVTGGILFLAVSAYNVEWFAPSVIMIVAAAVGWDRFMNEPAVQAPSRFSAVDGSVRIDLDGMAQVIQTDRVVIKSPASRKMRFAKSVALSRKSKNAPKGKVAG